MNNTDDEDNLEKMREGKQTLMNTSIQKITLARNTQRQGIEKTEENIIRKEQW